jgi:hypothetical protein
VAAATPGALFSVRDVVASDTLAMRAISTIATRCCGAAAAWCR